MIKNGAKGISDFIFIFFFDQYIKIKLTIVPIQKDKIITQRPADKPKSQPIPKINLPSPKPIYLPFEKYQSKTKGKDKIGPANKFCQEGTINILPIPEKFINIEIKDNSIKVNTNGSGIIL